MLQLYSKQCLGLIVNVLLLYILHILVLRDLLCHVHCYNCFYVPFVVYCAAKLNPSDADKLTCPPVGKRTSSPQNRKSSANYARRKSTKTQVRFKQGH